MLSQRRRNLFYGMYSGEPTSRLTEQKSTAEPRVQAGIIEDKRDKEEGENFGKSTTWKPSDQTKDRTDSAGQGDTGQNTIHADGPIDNPIQPKPDRV